jgi:hypothetical protein
MSKDSETRRKLRGYGFAKTICSNAETINKLQARIDRQHKELVEIMKILKCPGDYDDGSVSETDTWNIRSLKNLCWLVKSSTAEVNQVRTVTGIWEGFPETFVEVQRMKAELDKVIGDNAILTARLHHAIAGRNVFLVELDKIGRFIDSTPELSSDGGFGFVTKYVAYCQKIAGVEE